MCLKFSQMNKIDKRIVEWWAEWMKWQSIIEYKNDDTITITTTIMLMLSSWCWWWNFVVVTVDVVVYNWFVPFAVLLWLLRCDC